MPVNDTEPMTEDDLQQEVNLLSVEVERLRAELGHVNEDHWPPDDEIAGADVRCECCDAMIGAGSGVASFFELPDREVFMHWWPCPADVEEQVREAGNEFLAGMGEPVGTDRGR